MKLYKDPNKAIPLLVARLIKKSILTEKDALDILGEPIDEGKVDYPEPFIEWYTMYPMSGTRGNRKTGFKRQAFVEWMRHGFDEEEHKHKALLASTRAYKGEYPDGNQFVRKPHNFLRDDYWESWLPSSSPVQGEAINEGAFARW